MSEVRIPDSTELDFGRLFRRESAEIHTRTISAPPSVFQRGANAGKVRRILDTADVPDGLTLTVEEVKATVGYNVRLYRQGKAQEMVRIEIPVIPDRQGGPDADDIDRHLREGIASISKNKKPRR